MILQGDKLVYTNCYLKIYISDLSYLSSHVHGHPDVAVGVNSEPVGNTLDSLGLEVEHSPAAGDVASLDVVIEGLQLVAYISICFT